jgi:hypothetical protein
VVLASRIDGVPDEDALAGSAELLARSGLVQGRIIDAPRAAGRWELAEIDPAFGMLTHEAQLAVGAALASTLVPARVPESPVMAVADEVCVGWAVQYHRDSEERTERAAAPRQQLTPTGGKPMVGASLGQRWDER